ncbi:hypothetical protein K439DRAFT_825285 [Ramaria rubella]|nr:hypothetical protein K439DRAFT_825285 [Ramaria rubella]
MGKAKAAAAMPTVTSPSRVTRSPTKSTRPDDPSNRPIGGLPTSSPKRIQQHSAGDVVVPDSQAEQREKRQGLLTTPSKRYPGPRQGEVVPDSQEEETQAAARAPSTSPAIPLIDLVARDALEAEPPTPTPAAVKSSLRKGELPEGVTHTRGRGRPSSADPNRRVTVSTSVSDNREKDQSEEDDALTPIPEDGNMVVDEQLSPKRTRLRGRLRKSTPIRSVKAKAVALPKTRKTVVKVARAQPATTDAPVAGPSTRSRKRKSAAQAEPAESSKGSEVPLNAPPKKRQRGLTVTPAPAGAVLLDTRVVARRPDLGNIYMPGTVAMETTLIDPIPLSTVFSVKFDDGHNEDVDVAFMRQYEPEPGDIVQSRLRRKGKLSVCPAQVLDVERWANEEKVEIQELGRGPDADDYYVKGCDIGISQERILQQWNERRVSTRTLLRDQKFDQPVPNESLADIGFIVTLPDLPKSKRSLIKIIEASSGILYEDWSAIVSLNGTVEVAGRRMSGKASDMRLGKEFRRTTPKAVFCLTDEPRTTPKYLISLALGVPCLSIEWVLERVMQDNAEHHVDWPAYVLPAGHNPVTRLAASQAFDRAWWRDVDNLPKLVSQPPVLKPFAGKAFLCIGVPEFLFSKKEFGTFPKVILAMGASFVQAVTEITLVNVNGSQSFDYTVVDDGQDLVEYQDAQAVNVSWIKKCLVTGIEGPIPWPDREGS